MSTQAGNPRETDRRMTVPRFVAMKKQGQLITMLTAYDHGTAEIVDQAGIDGILVGDSVSMVVQGHDSTLPVTLDEMIYHAEMVGRAVRRALVVVDLPFPTNHLGPFQAVDAAGRVLKQSRAQGVKLEGGADQVDVISALVAAGIPVMAHVGLRPQSIHQLGSYRVQRDAPRLLDDAMAAEAAGAFAIVLECIPASTAAKITSTVSIPTIGIGAGPDCDGQILVLHDLLGLTPGRLPKHVKPYADLRSAMITAIQTYGEDVRLKKFPGPDQTID
jgi:3-methyl-2-oxobutanoate hydroxymethyltransferase